VSVIFRCMNDVHIQFRASGHELDKTVPSVALEFICHMAQKILRTRLVLAWFASAYVKTRVSVSQYKTRLSNFSRYNISRACDVVYAAITGVVCGEGVTVSSYSRHEIYIISSLIGNILVIRALNSWATLPRCSYFFTISVLGKLVCWPNLSQKEFK